MTPVHTVENVGMNGRMTELRALGEGVLSLTVDGNVVSFTVDSIKLDPENLEIKHRIRFHQNEITKLKNEITKLKNETEWMQDLLFYQEQELEKELERLKEIEVKTLEKKLWE